jgi:hypothetical protein
MRLARECAQIGIEARGDSHDMRMTNEGVVIAGGDVNAQAAASYLLETANAAIGEPARLARPEESHLSGIGFGLVIAKDLEMALQTLVGDKRREDLE